MGHDSAIELSPAIYYPALALLLLAVEVLYLSFARRLGAVSHVTPRSSGTHTSDIPTGGGIVFIVAACAFFIGAAGSLPPHFMGILAGGIVLGVVSFIDDLHDLKPGLRLAVQTLTVALTYIWLLHQPELYLLTIIIGVGFINAYNFMDGISGILVAYTLVTLSTLWYVFALLPASPVGIIPFIISLEIATVVFGIFNFRRNSRIFCGDVGSIVMGFFILFLMISFMLVTGEASCLVFLLVYGVDTVFTIFERLFKGENILTSHKSHLCQIFANRWSIPHLTLAMIYAGVQGVINVGYLLLPVAFRWTYVILVTALLIAAYFTFKNLPRSR